MEQRCFTSVIDFKKGFCHNAAGFSVTSIYVCNVPSHSIFLQLIRPEAYRLFQKVRTPRKLSVVICLESLITDIHFRN